jgi:hypothetical protein
MVAMSSRKREVVSFEGATVQVITHMEVLDGDLLFISSPKQMDQRAMDKATTILKRALGAKVTVLFISGDVKIEGVVRYISSPSELSVPTTDNGGGDVKEEYDPTRLVNVFRDVSPSDAPMPDFTLTKVVEEE